MIKSTPSKGVVINMLTRISHDIEVMGGKPCIKGTRVTVGMILMLISAGKTSEEILAEYPYLAQDDITQALMYAAWAVDVKEDVIVPA
jgi:uncharacterized protein (DUF433 family)